MCVQSGVPDDFLCNGIFIPTRAEEKMGGAQVEKTRGDRECMKKRIRGRSVKVCNMKRGWGGKSLLRWRKRDEGEARSNRIWVQLTI